MKRKKAVLGAASDDPVLLAKRAIRAAEKAATNNDDLALREAAETGWLAISSAADVAADRLGRPNPGGHNARRGALQALESSARLRRGTLVGAFEAARTTLHGACFHGAECSTAGVLGILDLVKETVDETMAAIPKAKRRSR